MEQFQILKQLGSGSGSFGRVFKAQNLQSLQLVAIKTVRLLKLSEKEKEQTLNQIRLLASIDSPNIIKYIKSFYEPEDSVLSIVMEFAEGGDLTQMIKNKKNSGLRFQESFIWNVASDILKGLKFLHSHKIIHRDVKPANIFFTKDTAKLGDFNISKIMRDQGFACTQAGTPYYTPPEIWKNLKYTSTCDIWSLGCLLYEMCTFSPPFLAKDMPRLSKKIISGFYEPIGSKYSKKLSGLIKRCLTVDHVKRPTAAMLLEHEMSIRSFCEGSISLIEEIKCPKMLKQLNSQLPENPFDKPRTQQLIELCGQNRKSFKCRSLKKINSSKLIKEISQQKREKMNENSQKEIKQGHENKVKNICLKFYRGNQPHREVENHRLAPLKIRLPKVCSSKNIE